MIETLWNWWVFDFWRSVASLAVGLLVIAPFFLIPSVRKRIKKSDIDIEAIGLLTIVAAIIGIGCYNYFGAGSGT